MTLPYHRECHVDDVERPPVPQQRTRSRDCLGAVVRLSVLGGAALGWSSGFARTPRHGLSSVIGSRGRPRVARRGLRDVRGPEVIVPESQYVSTSSIFSKKSSSQEVPTLNARDGDAPVKERIGRLEADDASDTRNESGRNAGRREENTHTPSRELVTAKDEADTEALEDVILSFQDVTAEELRVELELQARERTDGKRDGGPTSSDPEEEFAHYRYDILKLETLLDTLEMEAELFLPSSGDFGGADVGNEEI